MIIDKKRPIFFTALLALLMVGALFVLRTGSQTRDPEPVTDEGNELVAYYSNADENLIVVHSPALGEVITSPLRIAGEARGMWYFEANAPVTLVNWDGLIVATGYVMATEDWMTEEFVPFEGLLTFTLNPDQLVYPRGALIIHNDNPSGLPEHDRAIEIPVLLR